MRNASAGAQSAAQADSEAAAKVVELLKTLYSTKVKQEQDRVVDTGYACCFPLLHALVCQKR